MMLLVPKAVLTCLQWKERAPVVLLPGQVGHCSFFPTIWKLPPELKALVMNHLSDLRPLTEEKTRAHRGEVNPTVT